MNWLSRLLIGGVFAGVSSLCIAGSACAHVVVRSSVEVGSGELTLADLLGADSCAQLRDEAARQTLGAAPRTGSVRAFEGREIRMLLEAFANKSWSQGEKISIEVPSRVLVSRRGAMKSCEEISRFVVSDANSTQAMGATGPPRRENLDCRGARGVAENASLELSKISWNAALQRREFALRCLRPEDCVPFLVWTHERISPPGISDPARMLAPEAIPQNGQPADRGVGSGWQRLVTSGQTATLSWEQSGIRIVLPVTCLEAGSLGQFIRVRFKNAPRVLRAEVVGKASLRAKL